LGHLFPERNLQGWVWQVFLCDKLKHIFTSTKHCWTGNLQLILSRLTLCFKENHFVRFWRFLWYEFWWWMADGRNKREISGKKYWHYQFPMIIHLLKR
jgi:hypothetical protein